MKNPKQYMCIADDFKYKDRCTLGRYCYGDPILHFYEGPISRVSIGSFVSFGADVNIHVGGEHFTEWISTYPFCVMFDDVPKIECVKTKGDVVIGSDVWIGTGVRILSGVTIGHGAVIGAGSVVAKDVTPYTIVAGNPIREIRKRFTEEQIQRLLNIRWWECSDELIDKWVPLLMSRDIDASIAFMELEGVRV